MLEFPFHTHEKYGLGAINILVKVDDVAVVFVHELGHSGQNSLLVRAMDQQYCSLFARRIIHILYFQFSNFDFGSPGLPSPFSGLPSPVSRLR
jgi:hypothetical protein